MAGAGATRQTRLNQALGEARGLHSAGRLTEAAAIYRQILTQMPDQPAALHLLGVAALQQNDLPNAVKLIGRGVIAKPGNAEAWGHLAIALHRSGELGEALDAFERCLRLTPENVGSILARASLLADMGRPEEALAAYDRAIALEPSHPAALLNRGNLLFRLGRLDQAVEGFKAAVTARPDDPRCHCNLAVALLAAGRQAEAAIAFRHTLVRDPTFPAAETGLGIALAELARHEEAIATFDRALVANPRDVGAHFNRGRALLDLGRLEESLETYRRALAIDHRQVQVLINLGVVAEQLGRIDDALGAYRAAIEVEPQHAEAHLNYALALLSLGQYEAGWREYEWRRRAKSPTGERSKLGPNEWDGAPLIGQRILVYAEQGFGDTIQFLRYLPMLQGRGAGVIFECQKPLRRLISRAISIDSIIARGDALPAHDVHVSLLSLPLLFGTQSDSIPAPVRYMTADPVDVEVRRQQLSQLGPRRIGAAWQGNPTHKADKRRSIPLSMLSRAIRNSDAALVSVQVGPGRDQIADVSFAERPFDPFATLPANDFGATAAVIANLDLVITADTAVAHLAAAMGRPTWVLLPYAADWRWLRDREDSPWYPTMRLFRQRRTGDWTDVFARLGEALRQWR